MGYDSSENVFHLDFEEKKSVGFAWACFSDPSFTQTTCLLRLVFAAPRGDHQKQFPLPSVDCKFAGVIIFQNVPFYHDTCSFY